MIHESRKILRLSRLVSRISALFFIFTVFCIFDALQTMMRHEYNQIDIVAGEKVYITGSMPQGKDSIDDIVIHIEGAESVQFELVESFSGFWFGGKMWRGRIYTPVSLVNTKVVLTVEDMWEETDSAGKIVLRQNPTLIYPVYIWKDQAAKNATDNSFFVRFVGTHPFFLGVSSAAIAIAFAFAQWLIFRNVDKKLVACGYYFVHGTKNANKVYSAIFTPRAESNFTLGSQVVLLDRDLHKKTEGKIAELNKTAGVAICSPEGAIPQYGWFLCSVDDFVEEESA